MYPDCTGTYWGGSCKGDFMVYEKDGGRIMRGKTGCNKDAFISCLHKLVDFTLVNMCVCETLLICFSVAKQLHLIIIMSKS